MVDARPIIEQRLCTEANANAHGSDDESHLPNSRSMAKIQREAIIMERLTASPRVVGIYGHCALSILSESAPMKLRA